MLLLSAADWDIKVKWERIIQHRRVSDRKQHKLHQASLLHRGGSQESCELAGCAWAIQRRTGRLTVWLRCGSLGKEHGSRAVADLRWSQDQTSGDAERAESLLWTSPFRGAGAWWLWRDCLLSSLWTAQWISSQITGSDYIPPSLPHIPPSVLTASPPTPCSPRPANHHQLSELTAESLGRSWAMCHWPGNNKKPKP